MLPTLSRSKRSAVDKRWILLPKLYVYIGAAMIFFIGNLFGLIYTSRTVGFTSEATKTINTNAKRTVLVTGGLGFIGSHVVEDLTENGYDVVVFDNMSNGKNYLAKASAILPKDITIASDFECIQQKIHYVVHLAALISVEESTRLPQKYERVNYEGSRNVLNWAVKNGVQRVVAASSGAIYGIPDAAKLPLREEDATGGICAYATTKFRMEALMKEYNAKYGLPSTALRFFNVYGPRQDPHSAYSGVISWFMDEASKNGTLNVTGDGLQYRDFVYVKDVARAIRIAMLQTDTGFDVYNVCTGIKTTINDIATTIVNTFMSKAEIRHVAYRDGDVKESVCSTKRAEEKLQFKALYSLKEGIIETREWFMKQYV